MLWRDKVLASQQSFADTLATLTEGDVKEFREIFEHEFPTHTSALLGYLTSLCPADKAHEIRKLLGVFYPFVFSGSNCCRAILDMTLLEARELIHIIESIPTQTKHSAR